MFNKKVILSMTAVAMAGLIGCGDDSSSGSPAAAAPAKTDVVPASVKSVFELDNVTCTATVNFCKTVSVEGLTELAQCDGDSWEMQMLQNPVAGCENAATDPAATEPAAQDTAAATDPAATEPTAQDTAAATDPAATEPAAQDTAAATNPAVEPAVEPAAQDTAAVTEPAVEPVVEPVVEPTTQDTVATEPVASASGTVACQKGPICTTGPAALAAECSADEGETLLEACPAGGEACDVGGGVTMYLYEGAGMTCAELLAFMAM